MIGHDTCDCLWPTTIFAIIVKGYELYHDAIESHMTDLQMMWSWNQYFTVPHQIWADLLRIYFKLGIEFYFKKIKPIIFIFI